MAHLALAVTAPDGSFESWSETLPELIAVQPDDIVRNTRNWLDLVHPEDRTQFRDTALAARAERRHAEIVRVYRHHTSESKELAPYHFCSEVVAFAATF